MYSGDLWPCVAVGVLVVAVGELLAWAIIFRSGSYVRQKDALDKAHKKLEVMKATAAKGKKDKKQEQLESRVKDLARDLNQIKMRTGMISALAVFIGYQMMSRLYGGRVVAKLPFHAPGIMQRLSHNSIEGEDFTDCAGHFIMIMTMQALRVAGQKMLGRTPRSLARVSGFEAYVHEQVEKQKLS
jgi:hypothetical protein